MRNEPFIEACDWLLQRVPDIHATADRLADLSIAERDAAVQQVLDFLDYHLAPRVEAEERTLFPLLARAIHAPCDAETLALHNAAIRDLTRSVQSADLSDVTRVQDLLHVLASVIEVHLESEREIVLPHFEPSDSGATGRSFIR